MRISLLVLLLLLKAARGIGHESTISSVISSFLYEEEGSEINEDSLADAKEEVKEDAKEEVNAARSPSVGQGSAPAVASSFLQASEGSAQGITAVKCVFSLIVISL